MAWQARGSVWPTLSAPKAGNISANGSPRAQEALEHAWKLISQRPGNCPPDDDRDVGQGEGADRMELWFDRQWHWIPRIYEA